MGNRVNNRTNIRTCSESVPGCTLLSAFNRFAEDLDSELEKQKIRGAQPLFKRALQAAELSGGHNALPLWPTSLQRKTASHDYGVPLRSPY